MPLAFTDVQPKSVMTFAAAIALEKRALFLERFPAMLAMRGRGHFDDNDVAEGQASGASTCGLNLSLPLCLR